MDGDSRGDDRGGYGDDVVEQGGGRRLRLPQWRPSRAAAVLAAAALVIGLAAGYTAGHRHARSAVALPKPTVTASPSASSVSASGSVFSSTFSPALTQGTGACSVQSGQELQLGVQVTNQSTEPITLQTARAVLPLGGLRQVTWQWATCGAIPAGVTEVFVVLLPGQSTWLSATFKVQVHCPGPAPVQFTVGYQQQGRSVTASLPGFPDLGEVPYSGCQPNSAGSPGFPVVTH